MKKIVLLFLCLFLLLSGCTATPAAPTEPQPEIWEETAPTEVLPTEDPGCLEHVDADDDDLCDECGNSVIITIDFYNVNDLHGKIFDGENHVGVDEMTTYLHNAQMTQDNVIILSTGDMWQGSAESNLTQGALTTAWMNYVGFEAMALGNHEFDWGEDPIAANAELADFPLLAINVYDRATNEQVDYCQSSVMVQCDGAQIGIIGAIGDCYSSIAPDHTKGIYFKVKNELTQLVKEEAELLRSQGADFIVYIIHDGLGDSYPNTTKNVSDRQIASYYDASLSEGYVDLVFESHTHQEYILRDDQGVYHLQHGGDNTSGISHAQVQIHAIDGTCAVLEANLIDDDEYEDLADDPIIEQLKEDFAEELAPGFEILGYANSSHPGDDMRQLVADLYYLEGMLKWGDEYDIVLGGGFISIRSPGYLKRGNVTYAQLQSLFPFDNELVLCSIKGRDLRDKFFETDNYNYFICCSLYGEEVRENLDPNATYYIVVDSYTSTYKPNNLTEIERYGEALYARDLLANYIRAGGMS